MRGVVHRGTECSARIDVWAGTPQRRAVDIYLGYPCMTDTLLDLTIATQIVLRFVVRDEVARTRLPPPWTVSPIPSGASKGANLAVIFNDALLNQDAAGNPA